MKAKYKLELNIDSEMGVVELELSLHLKEIVLSETSGLRPLNL